MKLIFLENTDNIVGKTVTISYIESMDNGETWQKDHKNKIKYWQKGQLIEGDTLQTNNLITANNTNIIENGGRVNGTALGAIGITNNRNCVNAFYIKEQVSSSKLIKATKKKGKDTWIKTPISDLIYPKLENQRIVAPTGNLVKHKNLILISGVLQNDIPGTMSRWGNKSNSVVLLAKVKGKYKKLIEFKSKQNCVWFPYMQTNGNDVVLIFTKKKSKVTIVSNKDASVLTEVFLFHTKLDDLLKKDFEVISI